MKKLKTVLSLAAAAATLTLGLASAQATPATVAIKDLKLVGEKTSSRPAADIRLIGIVGHGGGHGYHGGHHYGRGGYHGHHHGRGGHHYGRGGRWMTPADAGVSPQVSL